VAQDITRSADVVINGSATGTTISTKAPTMSSSNPMTIVVNGDLNLNGWHGFGYGLLLVTGTLIYDPDANWNGLVLVIGQGIYYSNMNGSGGIQGAVLGGQDAPTPRVPCYRAPPWGTPASAVNPAVLALVAALAAPPVLESSTTAVLSVARRARSPTRYFLSARFPSQIKTVREFGLAVVALTHSWLLP